MDPGSPGRSGLATAGTALGLLLAVGSAVVLHQGSAAPERRWGIVAFPLVWAAPALLGLLARRRPVLLVPAAALGAVLSVLSLSGVTLLLLVPAGLHAAAAARGSLRWPGPGRTAVLLALPVLGLAAFVVLFVHQDPMCWEVVREPGGAEVERALPDAACASSSGTITLAPSSGVVGGGSTSDVVVAGEALVSGVIVLATLAAGWLAAGPPGAVARPRRWPGAGRDRPPVWVTVVLAVSTGLLLTMGGAVVAAPVTVPALLWAARHHVRGWRLVLATVVAAVTAGELAWGLVYLVAGESRPAIWLVPVAAAGTVAAGALRPRSARRMPVSASAGAGRANR